MTSVATAIDAARVELLLNELRLPGRQGDLAEDRRSV